MNATAPLFPAEEAPAQNAAAQLDLIDLSQFDGYGTLSRREQMFAAGIFDGLTQRAAAATAGVKGSPEVIDQAGHVLMRNPRVQRVLAQAWAKSGASIHRTLSQAAHLQQIAYQQALHADTAKVRAEAMRQWTQASTLICSIHGKLAIRVEGEVSHAHAHLHAAAGDVGTIPADALPVFAAIRRSVVQAQHEKTNPVINITTDPLPA